MPYGGGPEHELAMPEEVYDTAPATNAEFDTTTLRFTYTSLVTPGIGVRRGPRHRRAHPPEDHRGARRPRPRRLRDRPAVGHRRRRRPGAHLLRAPAGLAHDGTAPCLLYGYGSYEACIDPSFSTLRLSLLDRGFVFAIAHVRGGGRARSTLVRRRQAAAQAQHVHRLHRLRRAPGGRGADRARSASWHAARRPAASSWARSPTSGPTSSRPWSPRCPSSTA